MKSTDDDRRVGLAILGGSLVIAATLRVWLALSDDGNYWPDEIYQSIEPAHKLVFGYGLTAWEFSEGARNWTFPGLIAIPLKLASLAGMTDPRSYLTFLRLIFIAVSLLAPVGTYLLARAYGARTSAAATGAALVALAAPLIYFAPRGLSENPSASLVALGFALALWPRAGSARRGIGVSLIGLSVLLRLQNGLFAIGAVAILAGRREWRKAIEATAVLAVWALFLGVLDKITWGGWFASVINYVAFNLDPVKTAIFTRPPIDYYVTVLFTSMALPVAAFLVLAPFGAGRTTGITLVILGFLGVHSLIAHKELRFVIPAIPLLGAVAALGVQRFFEDPHDLRWMRHAVIAGALVCAGVSAVTFHQLTLRDVGLAAGRAYVDVKGQVTTVGIDESAYDRPGPLNRLLIAASRQSDLCGLMIRPLELVDSGGYSYLHRRVPLFGRSQQVEPSAYNYEIVFGPSAPGETRASEAGFSLVRVRATCAPAARAGDGP